MVLWHGGRTHYTMRIAGGKPATVTDDTCRHEPPSVLPCTAFRCLSYWGWPDRLPHALANGEGAYPGG